LVLAIGLWASEVLACSCPGWVDFAHELARKPVVFEGVVEGSPTDRTYRVRVTRVLKGDVAPVVVVRTEPGPCAITPAIGESWLFLPAEADWFGFLTHQCDGSSVLSELDPGDRALLSVGHAPTWNRPLAWAAGSVLVAVLGLVGFGIFRRRQRA
jgi:hypothetical protein